MFAGLVVGLAVVIGFCRRHLPVRVDLVVPSQQRVKSRQIDGFVFGDHPFEVIVGSLGGAVTHQRLNEDAVQRVSLRDATPQILGDAIVSPNALARGVDRN